jgi:hypothetical protein
LTVTGVEALKCVHSTEENVDWEMQHCAILLHCTMIHLMIIFIQQS